MTGRAVTSEQVGLVRTVLGDIEAADLGVTMSHEHLLMTGGWPVRDEPDFRLDSVDDAVAELGRFVDLGGAAVVEMTPLGFGRHAEGLAEVSRRTGAHVVACTGFHKQAYYADTHWQHRYDVATIADLLTAEVVDGLDRHALDGPVVDRTEHRAGVVKIATSYHRAGRAVERTVEAVGEVHRRTGVPVATHTDKGTLGHEQLDLLERAGVPSNAVVLGHIDHNPDPRYLAELASRGAYLCFDLPGRAKYHPDSVPAGLVAQLASCGLADRLLLGLDLARRSYWTTLGGGPGFGYLLETFVPRLRAEGLGEIADAALVVNPARAFAMRAP